MELIKGRPDNTEGRLEKEIKQTLSELRKEIKTIERKHLMNANALVVINPKASKGKGEIKAKRILR